MTLNKMKKPARHGKSQREKGDRAERHIVDLHKKIGVHAERVPLSGATHYQGNGADVDVYPWGKDNDPLVAEVKADQSMIPVKMVRALGENDLLFLKPDRKEPYVFMPWETYRRLVE